MEKKMHPMLFVLVTIVGTVLGQMLLKHGMKSVGVFPSDSSQYLGFFLRTFSNGTVIASLGLAVVAALGWIAALSKLDLSYAYPFMATTFPLVLVCSSLFFKEEVSVTRWIGVVTIWVGVIIISRS